MSCETDISHSIYYRVSPVIPYEHDNYPKTAVCRECTTLRDGVILYGSECFLKAAKSRPIGFPEYFVRLVYVTDVGLEASPSHVVCVQYFNLH